MRRTYFAMIAIVVLLGFASPALAQSKCHDLRALNSQTLAVDPLGNGDWMVVPGNTIGVVDWEPLSPYFIEYIPGNSAYPNAVAGRYWDYTQIWHFNDHNGREIGTFTVGSYHASFQLPKGKGGMGNFVGGGKITGGTGIFEGASGTLNENGPYLIWLQNGWTYGKYNATYIARVCMN